MKSEIGVIIQSSSYNHQRVKILFLTDSVLNRGIWMNFAKKEKKKIKIQVSEMKFSEV
jgi:hypothetical protein